MPTVVASPFTKGNPSSPAVNSMIFDHTSMLKLAEWRWGLAPLTPSDASNDISNLANALNFASPDATVPTLPVPQTPLIAAPCLQHFGGGILSSGGSSSTSEWHQLS